jgi:hypothetical protein
MSSRRQIRVTFVGRWNTPFAKKRIRPCINNMTSPTLVQAMVIDGTMNAQSPHRLRVLLTELLARLVTQAEKF